MIVCVSVILALLISFGMYERVFEFLSFFFAQFVADGVFFAELNEFLSRELGSDGYSGVEVRATPLKTEIIVRATKSVFFACFFLYFFSLHDFLFSFRDFFFSSLLSFYFCLPLFFAFISSSSSFPFIDLPFRCLMFSNLSSRPHFFFFFSLFF